MLYDGICQLCSTTVRFARRRMKPLHLDFAPLQSERGQAQLKRLGLDADRLDTIVLIEGHRAFTRSTAALRLLRHLRFPWPMLSAALIIPRPVRDAAYNVIARRRTRWFGTCPLPPVADDADPAHDKRRHD